MAKKPTAVAKTNDQHEAEAAAMSHEDKQAARVRFQETRRQELLEAGELHAHDADAPAGYGRPIEQPISKGWTEADDREPTH